MDNQLQLIAKQPPLSTKCYLSWNSATHFKREKYAYDTVLPAFERFQRILSNSAVAFHSYPFMYQAHVDETFKEFILLNDLRSNKFEPGFHTRLRYVPFNYDECARVLTELAKFHAISFAMKQSKADVGEFNKLIDKKLDEITFGENANNILRTIAVEAMKVFIPHSKLDELVEKQLILKIKTFAKHFIEVMRASTKSNENSVIVHGDCWISNIMFRSIVSCLLFFENRYNFIFFFKQSTENIASYDTDNETEITNVAKAKVASTEGVESSGATLIQKAVDKPSEKEQSKKPKESEETDADKQEDLYNVQNSEIRFIDWQCMRHCSVAIDLSYFFFCCTDGNIRKHMTKLLLDVYLKTLQDRIIELGGHPNVFNANDLNEEMRKFGKFGVGKYLFSSCKYKKNFIFFSRNGNDYITCKHMQRFKRCYTITK